MQHIFLISYIFVAKYLEFVIYSAIESSKHNEHPHQEWQCDTSLEGAWVT